MAEFTARTTAAAALSETADHQHVLAVVDIGDVSGDSDEGELRYELHQADKSKIQRRAGPLVHLPSHGGFLHLQAEDKDEIADEIAPIRGNPERRVGIMSRWEVSLPAVREFLSSRGGVLRRKSRRSLFEAGVIDS